MRIYIGHSTSLQFKDKLYSPLKESKLTNAHELTFPHENSDKFFNSREFLKKKADIMVAEVSNPSTGLGIELGWADIFDVEIILVAQEGCDISGSLKALGSEVYRYKDEEDMIEYLIEVLE